MNVAQLPKGGPSMAPSDPSVNREPARRRRMTRRRAVQVLTDHFAAVRRRDPDALLLDRVLCRVLRGEVETTYEAVEQAIEEERGRGEQPWTDPLPADLGPLGEGGQS
jgi:hypothetical protein